MSQIHLLNVSSYCGREHQTIDWPNHKEACKYHRKRKTPPVIGKKPLVCHIFIGNPEKSLQYWPEPISIDARILDTTSKYHFDHFAEFTSVLDDTQHSTLEGTETEPLKCAVCLRRPAITSGSFHSLPVTAEDGDSDNLKYYESMLRHYSQVGAFQGKPFAETWALFNDLRSSIAQMAALYVPVCDQRACLRKTSAMHEESIKKIFSNDGKPLNPVRVATQIYP